MTNEKANAVKEQMVKIKEAMDEIDVARKALENLRN